MDLPSEYYTNARRCWDSKNCYCSYYVESFLVKNWVCLIHFICAVEQFLVYDRFPVDIKFWVDLICCWDNQICMNFGMICVYTCIQMTIAVQQLLWMCCWKWPQGQLQPYNYHHLHSHWYLLLLICFFVQLDQGQNPKLSFLDFSNFWSPSRSWNRLRCCTKIFRWTRYLLLLLCRSALIW